MPQAFLTKPSRQYPAGGAGERSPLAGVWDIPSRHQSNEKLINIRGGEGGGARKGGPLWSPAVVCMQMLVRLSANKFPRRFE